METFIDDNEMELQTAKESLHQLAQDRWDDRYTMETIEWTDGDFIITVRGGDDNVYATENSKYEDGDHVNYNCLLYRRYQNLDKDPEPAVPANQIVECDIIRPRKGSEFHDNYRELDEERHHGRNPARARIQR